MGDTQKLRTTTGREFNDLPYVRAKASLDSWFAGKGWKGPNFKWSAPLSDDMHFRTFIQRVEADPEFDLGRFHKDNSWSLAFKLRSSNPFDRREGLAPSNSQIFAAEQIFAEFVLLHEFVHAENGASVGRPGSAGDDLKAAAAPMSNRLRQLAATPEQKAKDIAENIVIERGEAYADIMALWLIQARHGKLVADALRSTFVVERYHKIDLSHGTRHAIEASASVDPSGKSYAELSAESRKLANDSVIFLLSEQGLSDTSAAEATKTAIQAPLGCSTEKSFLEKLSIFRAKSAEDGPLGCFDGSPVIPAEKPRL